MKFWMHTSLHAMWQLLVAPLEGAVVVAQATTLAAKSVLRLLKSISRQGQLVESIDSVGTSREIWA